MAFDPTTWSPPAAMAPTAPIPRQRPVHRSVKPTATVFLALALFHAVSSALSLAAGQWALGGSGLLISAVASRFLWDFVQDPQRAAERSARRVGAGLDTGASVTGFFIQLLVVYAFFGLFTVVTAAVLVAELVETGANPVAGGDFDEATLLVSQGVVFTVLVFGALSWVFMAEDKQGRAGWRRLGLLPVAPLPTLAAAAIGFVAYLAFAFLLNALFEVTGIGAPENPQAEALARSLSIGGALLVSLFAGVGEELYFRGMMQPRSGNLRQAILFGAVHVSFMTPLQIIVPFVLGYGLGMLRTRVGLWAPIAIHVGIDVLAFAAGRFEEPTGPAMWIMSARGR